MRNEYYIKMDLLQTLRKLCEIQSVSYNESEIIQLISQILSDFDIKYIIDCFNPSKYNTYAPSCQTANLYIELGNTDEDILILYFHTDVVFASDDLFFLKINDDKIFGRGTSDMKSSIAGILHLLINNYQSITNQLLKKNKKIIIALIADEETTGTGVKRFINWYSNRHDKIIIKRKIKCILFEPSNDFQNIVVGCRGYSFIKISGRTNIIINLLSSIINQKKALLDKFPNQYDGFGLPSIEITKIETKSSYNKLNLITEKGVSCHASRPHLGKNPIEKVLSNVPNITFLFSEPNSAINSIPNFCSYTTQQINKNNYFTSAYIDVRTNLHANKEGLVNELMSLINEHDCNSEIIRHGDTIYVDNKDLIKLCTNNIQFNHTTDFIKPMISYGGNDSQQLIKLTKELVVSFGPGQINSCHTDEEFISKAVLFKTPDIMLSIINNFIN